jgi:23S rRNA pseudouridine1911/1915/1917 synthase
VTGTRGAPRPDVLVRGEDTSTARQVADRTGALSTVEGSSAGRTPTFDPEPRPPGTPPEAVVLRFQVPRELAGLRLDRFVQHRIPRLSRTRAQEIVRACAIRADGAKRRPGDIVRAGETVFLVRERFDEPETPQTFGVIHEDESVLVVDKPAGLPMHPSATYHKHTLSYMLRQHYAALDFIPRIAHRLDRETSGIVLCGKTAHAERVLKRAFAAHTMQKTYLAIVRGELAQESGEVALPMASVREGLHVLMEVRELDGLPAVTSYRVLARAIGHTLLELSPRSGRQHQLRLHLSAIGHSIVGDKLYGPEREAPFLEYIETGLTADLEQRLGLARQALHAYSLVFAHPETGVACEVRAPLPADMEALWRSHGGELVMPEPFLAQPDAEPDPRSSSTLGSP